ncbi:MAG: hypothetical protein II205_04390, partial [Bacteroidales bacterium]|nr:hypothetical protein [Bacteroidales bacterium]
AFQEGTVGEVEYYRAMANSKEIIKVYNREVRELSKEVQNNIKVDREKQGSLRALRAELSNVTKAYDSLSKEERESAQGLEMKEKVAELTQSLKNMESETGRDFRNVGNYIGKVVGKLGQVASGATGATGGVAGLTMGFKALSATPVIAILSTLVQVLGSIVKTLKSSEENANRMAIALAPLKAGGTALKNIFQALGGVLATAAEWLGNIADKLGLYTDKMKEEQSIVKEEIALRQEQRRVNEENAAIELQIAELRAKAAEKDKYNASERKAFTEEAIALQRKAADNEIALARREFEIEKRRSELAGNSAEENDRLSEAKVRLYNAERDYFNKVKELNATRVEAINSMKAETKATEDLKDAKVELAELEIEKVAKALSESDEAYIKQLERQKQITEARLKLAEESTMAEYLLQQDLLRQQADIDIARLEQEEGTDELILLRRQQFHKDMAELEAQFQADIQALANELLTQSLDTVVAKQTEEFATLEEKKKMYEDAYASIGNSVQALANLMAQSGEENKRLAQLSKVIALAQIAIEAGVATAKGIKSAQDVPFPGNLAAIGTTIAAILTGITSAISTVKSAKFATGGYVSGPGSGTSDSINARLSNGESVINARSTAMFGPLLSSLNQAGGGVAFNPAKSGSREGYTYLASAVAAGVKAAGISVAVDEIKRVETRVADIKELSVM